MAICCDSTENLGCYGHCDTVDTDITASSANGGAGVYTIITQEGYYKEFTYSLNEKITFTNFFNEDRLTIFYILNPIGQRVNSANSKDCFKVTTTVQIEV